MNKTFFQAAKFGIIGLLNTLINLIVYTLLLFFGVYYLYAALFAFLFAVLNSFLFNKYWTFRSKNKISLEIHKFFIVSCLALIVNLVVLFILVEFFFLSEIIAQVLAVSTNFILNFTLNKFWTFSKY